MLKINIQNQVRQTKLPKSKPLLPLFEAVTNSLQAIAQKGEAKGRVDIELIRSGELPGLTTEPPIESIRISDNGIGFTDENMDSFNTSFSDFKLKQGGKGIGRFSWLVAFERAEIVSTFAAPDGKFERSFVFDRDYDPDKVKAENAKAVATGTTVLLRRFSDSYRKVAHTRLQDIAFDLCDHFLLLLVRNDFPSVVLSNEGDPAGQIDLLQFFRERFSNATSHSFDIKGETFKMAGVRVKVAPTGRHRLLFAADGREVVKETFAKAIPNLPHPLGADDERFTYCAVVHGDYLDQRVNSARTDFEIDTVNEERDPSLPIDDKEISLEDIREAALECVRLDLAPYLSEIRQAKSDALANYVAEEAPHYRVLMKDADAIVDDLRPNASKLDIDLTLHAALYRKEAELKKLGAKVFIDADKISDYETYSAELQKFLEGENEVGLAALGKYVAHRRIMIDLLQRALSKGPADDKYPLEEVVHNLIFPMRSTSGDILYSQQNLWLVDERLSYHSYISSDRQLKSVEPIASNSAKRPDVLLFDHRYVFAEGERPVSSVVLIEFKRPMRDDYNKDDPIDQVLEVIDAIRKSQFLDDTSRPLAIASADIPCFAYLVCDLTPTLRQRLSSRDFTEHPDRQGFYNFHRGQRAYIEVISYEKLLSDAKKRNRVLFEKLNWLT